MKSGYLNIKENIIETLFALSHEEQEKGLMFQKWPPPNMSFVYSTPQINKFWMKNTECPLDIVFALNGVINQIHFGEPYSTNVIGNDVLSNLIVEMPAGTVKKLKIKIGDPVQILKLQ